MKYLYVLAALLAFSQVIQVEAILGLLALKAAGAVGFALGRASRGFGGRRFGGGRGFGRGYGRGYGRGFGRGFGRRGRYGRGLSEEVEQEARVEGLQMDAYFAAVQLGDEDGCGLRLVCELRTMDAAALGEEENMILALFGSNVPSSGRPDSPKLPYDAAAELGRTAGSTDVCAETYRSCQHGYEELIEALRDDNPEQ